MGTNVPDGAGGPGPGPAPVPTSSSGDTGPPAGAPQVSSPAPQPVAQQSKSDVNASTVCRIGQETVEEIVSRTQEVFSILKSLQPPVGSYNPQTVAHDKSNQDKQSRLQDVLKGIGMLFKRLRVCWEKCQENTGGMDFLPIESLIPLKEDGEGRVELEKMSGEHRWHGLPSDRVSDPFEGGRRGKSGAGEEERGRLQVRCRGAQRAGPADCPQEQTP